MQKEMKYLVLLQVDSIQTFLFEYLSKETNKQTLAKATANSNLVGKITKLSEENKDDKELKFQFRKSLFSDIALTDRKIVIDISGKCIVILTTDEKNNLEKKLKETEKEYTNAGITLTYLFEEIINNDEEKAYNRLIEKSLTPKKQNFLLSLSEFPYKDLFSEVDEEKDGQTTKQVLERYCQNYSKHKDVNKRSEGSQNLNQIAIIKVDLNNIGTYFKGVPYKDLKSRASAFEESIQSFTQFSENRIFSLYVAGDDAFIISRVDQIKEVLVHIQSELGKINDKFKAELTIAIAVLTTDYRSTFRYYLEKVEELLKQAKQDKTKDVVNMNGMILELNSCITFLNMYKEKNKVKQTNILHSRSKLHNTLEIIKGDAPFKRLNAMYILSKDGTHPLYKQLFEEIEESDLRDVNQVVQIKSKIQNVLLLSKYMDVEKSGHGRISYSPTIQEVFLFKNSTSVSQFNNDGKTVELQIKSFVKDINNKGFWFRLNELTTERNKEQLTKFLLNYQYQNQKIIRYDFQTGQDEENYRHGREEKHRITRTEIRNYRQSEVGDAIRNRNEFVTKIVEEILTKSCVYQQLCRERIIDINVNKKR